jgi:hypothetical protein
MAVTVTTTPTITPNDYAKKGASEAMRMAVSLDG